MFPDRADHQLPRVFRWMLDFWADLPSTNYSVWVASVLTAATCAGELANVDFSWEWYLLLGTLWGADLTRYTVKRKTHMEAPPTGPDVEDVATTEVPPDERADP